MRSAYLKEMLEHRKGSDAASMVKCRRRRLDNKGKYTPEKVRQLTRSQADTELSQLRQRFAWDDEIAPRQLSDRLKILAGCGYYAVSHKAESLIRFLPLRAKLLKVRQDGDIQEDLWELICFSLVDQRSYILNADFWGRLNGATLRTWKKELQELRRTSPDLAAACGVTLEEIETKVKELASLASSAKAGKDAQPVMDRLIEREERRVRRHQKTGEVYSGGGENGYWRLILIAIFVISGLARGFMRGPDSLSSDAKAQRARNEAYILERARMDTEAARLRAQNTQRLSEQQPPLPQQGVVTPTIDPMLSERARIEREKIDKKLDALRERRTQPPRGIDGMIQPGPGNPPLGTNPMRGLPQGGPSGLSSPPNFSPTARGPLNP